MFSEIMFMFFILSSMLEYCILGLILVMINLVRNLNLQLSIFPTIVSPSSLYIAHFCLSQTFLVLSRS